jgi:outer membrane lipoprotein-sorting protein
MIGLVALAHTWPVIRRNVHVSRLGKCVFVCVLAGTLGLLRRADAQTHAPTLDSVLAHLDESAKDFRSLSANVERTTVTVVVNDRSTEDGTLLVRGDKMLLQLNPPDSKTILRNGDTISIYTPGLKQVQEFNLGKNRDLADEFLLLGFGTSGKNLQKGFEIKFAGEDKIGDNKDVELDLTPRSASVAQQYPKIQIWLNETTWLPDQQQFTQSGSGDYLTVRYAKMVRNPQISDNEFKPHWPKGTTVVRPQGAQ